MRPLSALLLVMKFMMSINPSLQQACYFPLTMSTGQSYYLHNTEFPNNYSPGTVCMWEVETDPNSRITIRCDIIELPPSANCRQDRLTISLTGSRTFADGRNYCGNGNLSLRETTANRLTVGLFSAWYSQGGRFVCTITSVAVQNPNPNPNCDCGRRQEMRIVGGHETGLHEYPSMAALIQASVNDLLCGSSIIAPRYAVTAAHCLRNQTPQRLLLLVGDHNIESNADGTGVRYTLNRFISHPLFNNVTLENDIAIVQTTINIAFNAYVGPVCLPFRYVAYTFEGISLITLGWGTEEFTGALSPTLQEVDLTVINNTVCAQQLASQQAVVRNTELCTFTRGRDACQYDSGGPLMWYRTDVRRLELVGIISFGIGCASNYPSVNTRVTSFVDWIVSVTPDTQYCVI